MNDYDEMFTLSYGPETFPFHPDCYTWPRLAVYDEDGTTELNVHCIRDNARSDFVLMGFIDVDREDQISSVIYMAQLFGPDADVIMFKGVGLTDEMLDKLVTCKPDTPEFLDKQVSMMHVKWPTRFQRKILREAADMCRHGDFHESSLAYRLHAPVEQIHQHLELLTDLGLMAAVK